MNAMNRYANSADVPDFDAPQIVRRTRRRRAAGIGAVAAALLVAGGGTALATSVAGGSHSEASSTATKSDATLLFDNHGVTIPMDFSRLDLVLAKQALLKTQTKLGTVTEKAVNNCKPGSVVGVDPHTPKIVKSGDTVNLTLCAD
ncbi:hypothetical protein ABZY05_21655 [Streptomyces canus]|uniref:hypothetical protein n=1 Tax=Streptomyces canus TaxID=58343 RepID=UPI0033BBC844